MLILYSHRWKEMELFSFVFILSKRQISSVKGSIEWDVNKKIAFASVGPWTRLKDDIAVLVKYFFQ